VISRDPAGGWVRGKVSGRVLDPSADWVRIIPSDALRLRLDARVTIETDDHEIIYMSYNGRMHCAKETAERFRKGEALKAEDCYLMSAPTFETRSEKYLSLSRFMVHDASEARRPPRWLVDPARACGPARPRSWLSPV
jgi:hypothetical protein